MMIEFAKGIGIRLPYVALCALFSAVASAQDNANELAKKLSNPVSSLISVPFQNNADFGSAMMAGSTGSVSSR